MSKTKHQQILSFIEELAIGSKVSVRFFAKELDVSEGTAYGQLKRLRTKDWYALFPK